MPESIWVVPTADEAKALLNNAMLNAASTFSSDAARIPLLLPMVVARVRGAIRTNSRNKLSRLADSVPLEAKEHVLVLTIRAALGSVSVLFKIGETKTDFAQRCDLADKWLCSVRDGVPVEYPDDPEADPESSSGASAMSAWGSETQVNFGTT